MKRILALICSIFCVCAAASAQNQQGQQEQPTPEEMAAKEADRLGELLDLEVWQIFYVDSTLQHDYAALTEKFEELKASRVSNVDIYTNTRDEWMERIDSTYKTIFTQDQWNKYMKTGGAKAQKAREKRRAKADKNKK